MSKKIRVGVIFGGKSGEHEVSVQSAKSVMASLDKEKYTVVPIGIDKAGRWQVGPQALSLMPPEDQGFFSASQSASLDDTVQEHTAVDAQPETNTAVSQMISTSQPAVGHSTAVPPQLAGELDVIIPVLHGSFGEDGTIQGLLELLDVPYVGAGVLASAVGLDKVVMKTVFAAQGLPQVGFSAYTRRDLKTDTDGVVSDVERKIGYPCFVKPANLGSSVGISKARDRTELQRALEVAAKYDRKIIVEQGLNVREIEIAVLGNEEPRVSVPGEIIPSNEFYDYKAKYISGESALMIPANLPQQQVDEIRALAVKVFQAIDCSGLARVDFFVEKGTGKVLVNEINTMPGFTKYSMYPKLWDASGLPYDKLIDALIQLALERHAEKQQIQTNFDLDD